MTPPKYDLRLAKRDDVLPLFEKYHGYKSLGKMLTYCFAVYEGGEPVAAFAWVPPPPGAAKAVCPDAPFGVLSLSRMVAVPPAQRELKHISRPLKRQMRHMIDRTRWPVLVTYADEGQGHTGYVYKCAGWQPTKRAQRNTATDEAGARVSTYSNGARSKHSLTGKTWLQRFEHWACPPDNVAQWMADHGWVRQPIEGRVWASGNQAFTYVNINHQAQLTLAV